MALKKLAFLLAIFFLVTGCTSEDPDSVPFNFNCYVRFVDKDGNSLLKQNSKQVKEITASLPDSLNKDISISSRVIYLDIPDYLSFSVNDERGYAKNEIRDYTIVLQSPDVFGREGNDTIRVRFQIKNHYPSVLEAFFNEERARSMEPSLVVFEIANK